MVAKDKLLTVEEFWEQYAGQSVELVHGKVIEMPPSGFLSSTIAGELITELNNYLRKNRIGRITTSDGGYWLFPDTLRVPDVGFVSNDKIAKLDEPTKFLPFPPDLAVKVISPSESAGDIHDKVNLYLQAGTSLVWVIYPEPQNVVVHTPDMTSRTLSADDTLEGGDVLPGFSVKVSDLFPKMPE